MGLGSSAGAALLGRGAPGKAQLLFTRRPLFWRIQEYYYKA